MKRSRRGHPEGTEWEKRKLREGTVEGDKEVSRVAS